jgi:hypothetical protein
MSIDGRVEALERAGAVGPVVPVALSGLAGRGLLGSTAGWALAAVLVVVLGALWLLALTPWSRYRLPRHTRAVAAAALCVGVGLLLTMTGHFWAAALCVAIGAFVALSPGLADRAREGA